MRPSRTVARMHKLFDDVNCQSSKLDRISHYQRSSKAASLCTPSSLVVHQLPLGFSQDRCCPLLSAGPFTGMTTVTQGGRGAAGPVTQRRARAFQVYSAQGPLLSAAGPSAQGPLLSAAGPSAAQGPLLSAGPVTQRRARPVTPPR
eukprot:766002-Hanusia_phi.AAC.1